MLWLARRLLRRHLRYLPFLRMGMWAAPTRGERVAPPGSKLTWQVRQVVAQLPLARLPASPLWGAGGAGRQPSGGVPRLLLSLLLGLCWRSPQPITAAACHTTPLLPTMCRAWWGRGPRSNVVSMLCARPSLRLGTGALVPPHGGACVGAPLGRPGSVFAAPPSAAGRSSGINDVGTLGAMEGRGGDNISNINGESENFPLQ